MISRVKRGVIFILMAFVGIFLIAGCSPQHQCVVDEDTNLYDLLVEDNYLPPGWFLGELGIGIEYERSRDSAGSFYSTSEYGSEFPRLLDQHIYRHKCLDLAESDYDYATGGVWDETAPTGWNFRSTTADESGFFCEHRFGIYVCKWVARYDCIVIDVGARIIPGYITVADMENIVMKIDERASEILDFKE